MLKVFFFTSCCILASTWKTASFGTGSSASRHEIFRYSTFQLYSIHLYSHLFVEVNLEKKRSGKLTVMFFFFFCLRAFVAVVGTRFPEQKKGERKENLLQGHCERRRNNLCK